MTLSKPFFKGICVLLERAMYGIDESDLGEVSAVELRRRKALLRLLLNKGLLKIDVSRGEPIYRITDKGTEFLRNYAEFELYNRRFGALRVNV